MEIKDYSALCEMLIDGAVHKSNMTGDVSVLNEPGRLMQLIRSELPLAEKAKLSEAIMQGITSYASELAGAGRVSA